MDYYLLFKTLHIISVISWMAGLLYLPRLFVYHTTAERGSKMSENFKVMERRLFFGIMTPAMFATWIFGLFLASEIGAFYDGWFHLKLVPAVLLTVFHFACGKWMWHFQHDTNRRSRNFFRIVNEVPTILMILIVVFVIYKPFT